MESQRRLDEREPGCATTNSRVLVSRPSFRPSDVIGLDTKVIIRVKPTPGSTDFDASEFASIEFYEQDFPWRYTPADAGEFAGGAPPWVALVVLTDSEVVETSGNRPSPFVTVTDAARVEAFPGLKTLSQSARRRSEGVDRVYSELVCRRRLQANADYTAFVVPVFEAGRLAGLGYDSSTAPSPAACAWTSNGRDRNNLPFYFRWRFRTRREAR